MRSLIATLAIALSAISATAHANGPVEGKITSDCNLCIKLDSARAEIQRGTSGAVLKTAKILDRTFLSKNKALRAREIESYLKLAAIMIPRDETDSCINDLYDTYRDYVPEFKEALAKMPVSDARMIRKGLDGVKLVIDNGNGSPVGNE